MITNEFLTSTGFSLKIVSEDKAIEMAVSKYSHPSISNKSVRQSSPRRLIPHPGTALEYDPLSVVLHLDQDLKIYERLYEWVINCSDGPVTREIVLTIYSPSGVPKRQFVYHNAFPTQLGGLDFDATAADDPYITLDATFEYSHFSLQNS